MSTDIPSIPGFNVQLALRQLGNNMKLYTKLLDQFQKSYAAAGQDIADSVNAGDYETAERSAHTIKGLAGSLGVPSLQEAAAALEKLCKTQTPATELEQPLALFSKEIEVAVSGIRGYLAQAATAGAPQAAANINTAQLSAQLAALATHVDDNDARALMLFDEMRQHLASYDRDAAAKIGSAFEMFDFVTAAEIIAALRARLS